MVVNAVYEIYDQKKYQVASQYITLHENPPESTRILRTSNKDEYFFYKYIYI